MGRFIFLCLFFWWFFLTDWDPMVKHHQTTIWENIVWNLFHPHQTSKSKRSETKTRKVRATTRAVPSNYTLQPPKFEDQIRQKKYPQICNYSRGPPLHLGIGPQDDTYHRTQKSNKQLPKSILQEKKWAGGMWNVYIFFWGCYWCYWFLDFYPKRSEYLHTLRPAYRPVNWSVKSSSLVTSLLFAVFLTNSTMP